MNNLMDDQLRDIVRQSCEQRVHAYSVPSFEVLWSRAKEVHANEPQKKNIWILFRLALTPAMALAAIFLVLTHWPVTKPAVEPLPMVAVSLQLPTDNLLKMAQQSFNTKLPTDLLKWRTQ